MKRYFAVVLVLCLAVLSRAGAAGVDDQYVQLFNLIQEADSLAGTQPEQALAKYRDAQAGLLKFRQDNPNWSPTVVNFRLEYLAGKISALSGKAIPAPAPPSATTNQAAAATPPPAQAPVVTPPAVQAPPVQSARPTAPSDWENQLSTLRDQVRQLQADKGLLEAKLKEAFSAQPAQSDPQELARAQQSITALQKENDLLKVAVEGQKAKPVASADPKALEQAQQASAEAARQLAAQKELVAKLTLEKEALQSRVQKLSVNPAAARAPAPVPVPPENPSQLKQLQRERDRLQKELDAANKTLARRKGKGSTAQTQELETEVTTLRSRLDVLEAKAVPYTTEELALLKTPETTLPDAAAKTSEKPMSELSPGLAILVGQARRYYQAGEFDKAETSYAEVVRQDPKNVAMLTDLASIQVEASHFGAADTNLTRALTLAPNSAYTLSVLGRLRLRQGKLDEALDALSRAAKLEPGNAEVQNFLGLTLSEKGQRGPAEAALRKAIELDPNYAVAHNNLAVVYVTGKPPAVALARWHYQKALAAGGTRNPKLEQLLEQAK